MRQKIVKIGTSAGITLPKKIRDEMNLKVGEEVQINYDADKKSINLRPKDQLDEEDQKIAKLTHSFINRYRSDLEELARK